MYETNLSLFIWFAADFIPFIARTKWGEVNIHGLYEVSLWPVGHSGKQKYLGN